MDNSYTDENGKINLLKWSKYRFELNMKKNFYKYIPKVPKYSFIKEPNYFEHEKKHLEIMLGQYQESNIEDDLNNDSDLEANSDFFECIDNVDGIDYDYEQNIVAPIDKIFDELV